MIKIDERSPSTKENLRLKVIRVYLNLEARITADHLVNRTGANLVGPNGKRIDVHPNTVKYYLGLKSLIVEYINTYGTDPAIKDLRNRWATPVENIYFN